MKLDERVKELIAIGASVTANCRSCLQYHVGKARDAGAGEEEISDAVEAGKMVRSGAASQLDRTACELKTSDTQPPRSRTSSCCG
jgi:AhpD family alkylhydroperoxidase